MADVFISYKAEDRARVRPLVEALEAEGLSVWWDAHVGGGEAWRETIAEHLDGAGCVLVAWSKRSTGPEGRFVRDEASRAQRRGVYLPVTIDKVEPPLGFGETQALPLTGWKGGTAHPRYRAVSKSVHSMLGREAPAEIATGRSPFATRRVVLAGGGAAAAAVALGAGWLLFRPAGARANTIAVLPFANLSGDPSQNYFSDGMAEEVRAALASLSGLEVVARTSSEMLRNADAITVARRLSVANVITGSVRRSPSTVRVSAQLIDGANGLERWSQSFDRPLGDVLQIQSDIAANVARALSIELSSAAAARETLGGTKNAQALDLLLQATAMEGSDGEAPIQHRISLLDRAVQLDPNYAEAHARKGLTQALWAISWATTNAEKFRAMAEADRAIRRAIAIAPAMPLGYSALGFVYQNQLMVSEALRALERAAKLPGANAAVFFNYAHVLSQARRQAQAESAIERALILDPLNPIARQVRTAVYYYGRRYAEAAEAARRTLSIAPDNNRARALLVWSLMMLGRPEDAVRELHQMPSEDYRRLVTEGVFAARSGRRDDAVAATQKLLRHYGETVDYQLAEVYAQLGLTDQAFAALDRAWSARDAGLTSLQVDPFMDPLRADPRFVKLAERIFG